jgi:hypothetical protein
MTQGARKDRSMSWIERLAQQVSWRPISLEVDWDTVENLLGTPLPKDFKEFNEAFGRGQFSGAVHVFSPRDASSHEVVEFLASIRRSLERVPAAAAAYSPYGLYSPGQGGLLEWGESETGARFYWLTEAQNPDDWPVIARSGVGGEWYRFNMSMSEFVFHVITDVEIEMFTIADVVDQPFYDLA